MTKYIKKLAFPLLWELMFLISLVALPSNYNIYTNFIFYFGIIIYFCFTKDFTVKEFSNSLKQGKKFWVPVLFTVLGMIGAFIIVVAVGVLLPNINSGMFNLRRSTLLEMILFAVETIILPPLAEELFFRKAIIKFDNKKIIIITALIGMILYGLEHSFSWLGILEAMIIAVPLTYSYIKTKNIYIPIVAHFIVNLVGNLPSVIFSFMSLK